VSVPIGLGRQSDGVDVASVQQIDAARRDNTQTWRNAPASRTPGTPQRPHRWAVGWLTLTAGRRKPHKEESKGGTTGGKQNQDDAGREQAHFLALLFAPFSHLAASAASLSASADAAFFAAASALRAWPAAFLLLPPSAPPFFAMAIAVSVLSVVGLLRSAGPMCVLPAEG